MRTVHEVSRLTGVSIRALQYYDRIGLLRPAGHTEAGYRLYDDEALKKLQQILLYRELEFSLKDIRMIMENPKFDRGKALDQQIHLLELKREHIDHLLDLAREIKAKGEKETMKTMNFEAFDTSKMDEYASRARESWGNTPEWKEYEEKSQGRSEEESASISLKMMEIFREFGAMRDKGPGSDEAKAQVQKLKNFITENLYTCSDQILLSLGKAYGGGGEMNENIDRYGGEGTGVFAMEAVKIYCRDRGE